MKSLIETLNHKPAVKKTAKKKSSVIEKSPYHKKFSETMKRMRLLQKRANARLKPVKKPDNPVVYQRRRVARITELEHLVRQLRIKLKDCPDRDVVLAQLVIAESELFHLTMKTETIVSTHPVV